MSHSLLTAYLMHGCSEGGGGSWNYYHRYLLIPVFVDQVIGEFDARFSS